MPSGLQLKCTTTYGQIEQQCYSKHYPTIYAHLIVNEQVIYTSNTTSCSHSDSRRKIQRLTELAQVMTATATALGDCQDQQSGEQEALVEAIQTCLTISELSKMEICEELEKER